MKKFFKYLCKVVGVAIFLAITVFVVIYALNTLGVTNINLDFTDKLWGWDVVLKWQEQYSKYFVMILSGIAILCLYISLTLVLSLIPVAGKLLKGVVKFVLGGIVIFVAFILILLGGLGVAGVMPAWL